MNEQEQLRAKLNQETARFPWSELLRHFASGNVIAVDSQLDLIHVALAVAIDDGDRISALLTQQLIGQVSDVQAQQWLDDDAQLWTVVVKPWILVQLINPVSQNQVQ